MKKSVANSYQANRSFENDLFKHRKKPKRMRVVLWVFLFAAIAGGVGYLLTRPFMYIAHIEVSGLETVDQQILLNDVWTKGWNDKLLGVSRLHILRHKEQFVREVLAAYPFSSIAVTQHGRTLLITVTERAQGGLVHAANTWMLYDLQGNYIRDLTSDEIAYVGDVLNNAPTDHPLFYKDTPIIELGDQSFVLDHTAPVLVAVKAMHDALIHAGQHPLIHILPDNEFAWGQVKMREGHTILYDFTTPPKQQIERLETVQRELQSKGQTYSTIDVRFDGRVYVH